MLESIFIILLIFAILLVIITIEYERHIFWNMICSALSGFLWFILGVSMWQLDRPYEMYNVSSSQIEVGVHTYTMNNVPGLSFLFLGIGIIMFI
jgi:hypothetical protein